MNITPGTVFSTKLPDGSIIETGCIAQTAPDVDGNFDGIDSDGVEVGFNTQMVAEVTGQKEFAHVAFGVRKIDVEDIVANLRANHGVSHARVLGDYEYLTDRRFCPNAGELFPNVLRARENGTDDALVLLVFVGWDADGPDDWFDAELINELGQFPIYFCHPGEEV